jgi:DNA replication protein DnaD
MIMVVTIITLKEISTQAMEIHAKATFLRQDSTIVSVPTKEDLKEMIGTMIEGGKGTMEGTIEEQTSIARDIKGEEERVHNMHTITFLLVNLRSNRMSLKYIIDPISRTCKFST